MSILTVLFAVMMSIPFLVPHCGFIALFGFVPLLCMERVASLGKVRKVWIWHYGGFVLWNALTTFWIWNATAGGAVFAILANALQMSLIFGIFRFSKKYFKGVLPYLFLTVMWIAWERAYYNAEISWPWLVLGNSFAFSVGSIQWYEYTGTLGGSLWIWAANLGLFGIITALSDGRWNSFNIKAKIAAIGSYAIVLAGPFIFSWTIYWNYKETEKPLQVLIAQPNIDPYSKFEYLSQEQQDAILLGQLRPALAYRHKDNAKDSSSAIGEKPLLVLAPETFTNFISTNDFNESKSFRNFVSFLKDYPNVNLLFGASSYDFIESANAPSITARKYGEGIWTEAHNSALITDGTGRGEIYHKSRLVVGVEKTPYPVFFCKVDNLLGGVMGRDIGQEKASTLHVKGYSHDRNPIDIPIGCAICYESVYGEYCTGYVKAGAQALAIITNDAWWGDTPGYRQHFGYASLRAIETRRDIVRCANTGLSGIIDQKGDVLEKSSWWKQETLSGSINLNDKETVFVRQGDIIGKLCSFLFILLALATIVRIFAKKEPDKTL